MSDLLMRGHGMGAVGDYPRHSKWFTRTGGADVSIEKSITQSGHGLEAKELLENQNEPS